MTPVCTLQEFDSPGYNLENYFYASVLCKLHPLLGSVVLAHFITLSRLEFVSFPCLN